MSVPTQDQIDAQLERTIPAIERGQSQWPGMSYEQGVDAALRWATGETDDPPMEDE
jgi:hypothetical protein